MNQPKTNDKPLSQREFEAEFHRLLGRLVYAHSQFDYNVGLQLRLLGRWYGTEVAEFLDPKKVPFSKRLKKLRSMILDIYASSGEEAFAELSNFFKRADEATALRNDYVHGSWSWHYRELSRRELVLQFRPLHWNMTPVHPDDSVTMGLEEFAEQVKCAEKVLMSYFRLVEKYSRFAKTPSTNSKA